MTALFKHIIQVYCSYGGKVLLYPFVYSSISSILSYVAMTRKEMHTLVPVLFAFLFGISSWCIQRSFGIKPSLPHTLLLIGSVILCYLLTLFAGVFFSAYFTPIAAGNLIFGVTYFLLDYFFSNKALRPLSLAFYLLGALASTLIIYVISLVDWEMNLRGRLFLLVHPLAWVWDR